MLKRFLAASWIDRGRAQAAFDRPDWRIFQWVYLATACFWCVTLACPISATEFGQVLVGAAFLVCLFGRRGRATLRVFLQQPLVWMLVLWAGWQAATLLWTPDLRRGLDQFGVLRFAAPIFTIWPVMNRRRWMVAALAAGFLALNLGQLINSIAYRTGITWLQMHMDNGRNGGWLPVVNAGELLVAALGLHLPAAFMGRGRIRVFAALASGVTLLGIFASGTRAAWLAAAVLVLIVLCVALWRLPARRRAAVLAATGAGGGVLALVLWLAAGDFIAKRIGEARAEAARAVEQHDYNSDNGLRIIMGEWALRAFRENPIIGIGVGGYPAWVREHHAADEQPAYERFEAGRHTHCHNTLLQVACTAGVVGLVIGLPLVLCSLYWGFAGIAPGRLGTYDAGPAFAFLGLLLITHFDAVYVSPPIAAVLLTLMGLNQAWRPREEIAEAAETERGESRRRRGEG